MPNARSCRRVEDVHAGAYGVCGAANVRRRTTATAVRAAGADEVRGAVLLVAEQAGIKGGVAAAAVAAHVIVRVDRQLPLEHALLEAVRDRTAHVGEPARAAALRQRRRRRHAGTRQQLATEQKQDPACRRRLGQCLGHVVVRPHVLPITARPAWPAARDAYASRRRCRRRLSAPVEAPVLAAHARRAILNVWEARRLRREEARWWGCERPP